MIRIGENFCAAVYHELTAREAIFAGSLIEVAEQVLGVYQEIFQQSDFVWGSDDLQVTLYQEVIDNRYGTQHIPFKKLDNRELNLLKHLKENNELLLPWFFVVTGFASREKLGV